MLPVSIVIPTIPSREKFLEEFCLPSVRANGDVEIVVVRDPGNGSVKRNLGIERSTREYLLFVDDDCVLLSNCVSRMLEELQAFPEAAFCYSDYERIVMKGVASAAPSGYCFSGPFSVKRLRSYNYISTTSMVRRSKAPRWDESLERFQDWDFWLSIVGAGGVGRYIPSSLYEPWQIDNSVTNTVKANPYVEMIVEKHRLNR